MLSGILYAKARNSGTVLGNTCLPKEFNQRFRSAVIPRLLVALLQLSVQVAQKITVRGIPVIFLM